jgi:hypothetical protein
MVIACEKRAGDEREREYVPIVLADRTSEVEEIRWVSLQESLHIVAAHRPLIRISHTNAVSNRRERREEELSQDGSNDAPDRNGGGTTQ